MSDKIITSIGLMSGTSIDGIDISLIKSDGHSVFEKEINGYYPYDLETKKILKNLIDNKSKTLKDVKNAETLITNKHIEAVNNFIRVNNLQHSQIDVIGFSGHTILHDPAKLITWQIGNAQMLASKTGIDVVTDFRTKDVVNNGQGAPLVPIYHHSIFKEHKKPVIVLNIGGVSNITYLQDNNKDNLIACDICFGNAPMDDLVYDFDGRDFDKDGELAMNGKINYELANTILSQDYFLIKPPKSLDRNHFSELLNKELMTNFSNIKLEDALRTICYIIAKSLDLVISDFNKKPMEIIVCGGGRRNKAIVKTIEEVCSIKVTDIDLYNFDGSSIESQAFAFLAIRNLKNLPITFRKTTGVLLEKCTSQTSEEECSSSCGGVFYHA